MTTVIGPMMHQSLVTVTTCKVMLLLKYYICELQEGVLGIYGKVVLLSLRLE